MKLPMEHTCRSKNWGNSSRLVGIEPPPGNSPMFIAGGQPNNPNAAADCAAVAFAGAATMAGAALPTRAYVHSSAYHPSNWNHPTLHKRTGTHQNTSFFLLGGVGNNQHPKVETGCCYYPVNLFFEFPKQGAWRGTVRCMNSYFKKKHMFE